MPVVLDHALVPGGEPVMVTTDAGLSALLGALREAGRFAYDTEFIGEQTFYARFCVIQVATADEVWLIDALAEMELKPFWELLADSSVEKVVHAGQQDLEPVFRMTGRGAAHVFDTQIAAGFAGHEYPLSLSKLVTLLCDADPGGDFKFSQWDRRPLTARQKAYAANDVRYLLLLRELLFGRIAELGHTDKALAEFASLASPEAIRKDPLVMKLKARGAGKLGRKHQAVCNALLRWRHAEAERHDVPVRAFLGDQALVDLAKAPVETAEQLRGFKGVPRPVKERYAQEIVRVTAEALAGELPPRRAYYRPLGDEAQQKLDVLWPAVRAHCEQRSISPTLVLNKKELTSLVRAEEAGAGVPENRLTRGWRQTFLEPVLGALVAGGA